MNRKWVVLMGTLILVLAAAIPAAAIVNGEPDNGEHPYVAMLVFYNSGEEWLWACSGALLSDRLILTAAHCLENDLATDPDGWGPDSVRVYLDETVAYGPFLEIYPKEGYYTGIMIPHPKFDWSLPFPETYDIGLIILDQSVEGLTEFAQLPELNYLDQFTSGDKRDVIFTDVGYGLNDTKPVVIELFTRYMAQSFLMSLDTKNADDWAIQLSNNPGQWSGSEEYVSGGICSGDSGGPTLFGGPESNLVVGVHNAVILPACAGYSISWRVDIAESLDFIAGVVEAYGLELP